MSNDLRVAIIGAGRMSREHIPAFADISGVKVAGIYSRSSDRASGLAGEFGIPLVAKSLLELKERSGAELAVVTVSAEAMADVASECLTLDWDLFLEKPAGYNLGQAEAIRAAAKQSTRKVWVALNRRFLSSTRAAIADLSGRPGPRYIQVLDQLDSALTASYGHPPEITSHLMYFSSIHLIDYFSMFGRGAVESVTPIFRHDAAMPWVVSAAIEFESGDKGMYQAVWEAPGPWAVAVNTKEVRWEFRPLERATYQKKGERRVVETELSPVDQKFKPGFRLQAEQAVLAAQRQASDAPTLDQAIDTMRLISRIYEMGRS